MNGKPVLQIRLTKVEFNLPIDDALFTPSKQAPVQK
jgi:hypothetical protein